MFRKESYCGKKRKSFPENTPTSVRLAWCLEKLTALWRKCLLHLFCFFLRRVRMPVIVGRWCTDLLCLSLSLSSPLLSSLSLSPSLSLSRPVKLFVGGLAWETTEASLQKVFEIYGEIVEVSIMRHPSTMCSRGFGFVTLAKRSDAEAACNDKHTIDGRVVEAKISVTPGQNSPGGSSQAASKRRKVFVGGLSAETTDEDFRKYFEQFGEISESQILQDHYTGRSRGFGFITFTTDEATQKVFSKGRFHELKGKLVEVKSATPRQQNKGNSRGRGIRSNKPQSANANRGGGGVVGNMRRNYPYGVTPQGGVPYGMDPSTGYSYPGYFPSYNQVMPGPYVYGTDAGVSTVSPVPGYAQNAGYSMGSFPVPPQGTQPGGFIVPPQFVHPGTANGNELDPTGVLMPMPVPQTIALEGTRAPVQQQTVLPDGITE